MALIVSRIVDENLEPLMRTLCFGDRSLEGCDIRHVTWDEHQRVWFDLCGRPQLFDNRAGCTFVLVEEDDFCTLENKCLNH